MTYEVGKFYRVPTVYAPWNGRYSWWPVLGPYHEDVEIAPWFADYHYHFDFRFCTPRQFSYLKSVANKHHGAVLHKEYGAKLSDPVLRRRKCHREMTTFPIFSKRGSHPLPKVVEKYAGQTLGSNGKCPHRGVDLNSIKPVCGVIVCPLHVCLYGCVRVPVRVPEERPRPGRERPVP